MTKRCGKCRDTKDVSEFYSNRARVTGIDCYCKNCRRTDSREGMRKWGAKPENAEKRRQRDRDKYVPHPMAPVDPAVSKAKRAATQRRFHQKPEYKARHAQRERWKRAMAPSKYRESARTARRRQADIIAVTYEQWQAIMAVFDGRCAYCGDDATSVDHFVPIAAGGNHVPGNLVPACKSCNSSKNDSDPFEWMGETSADLVVAKLHDSYAAVSHA